VFILLHPPDEQPPEEQPATVFVFDFSVWPIALTAPQPPDEHCPQPILYVYIVQPTNGFNENLGIKPNSCLLFLIKITNVFNYSNWN
jgi:hypothetical protein